MLDKVCFIIDYGVKQIFVDDWFKIVNNDKIGFMLLEDFFVCERVCFFMVYFLLIYN